MQCSTVLSEAQVDFEDNRWDLSRVTKMPLNGQALSLSFKDYVSRPGLESKVLPEDFCLIAKALVIDKIEQSKPKRLHYSATHVLVASIQKLEIEMRRDGLTSILDCMHGHLNGAIDNYGQGGGPKRQAFELRRIVRRLADLHILPDLVSWDHPLTSRKTHDASRINIRKNRESLSSEEAYAIAELFHVAETPEDVFYSSILALMCCAPCRISEIGSLPVNIEVVHGPTDKNEGGVRFKYGLRWWPVKGGKPQVKFIPGEMVPVAQRAVQQLRELTEDARRVAALSIVSDQIPLPDDLEHIREEGVVTSAEVARVLGISKLTKRMLKELESVGYAKYSYESLQRYWRNHLPKKWPIVSDITRIDYGECLTTHFVNQFNSQHTRRCLVQSFTPSSLGSQLTPKGERKNIFERNAIYLSDGSVPQITTHQIRHYLNTIAQRANVPQAHIARWSGRKLIMQNEDYDHTDLEGVVQSILTKGKSIGSGVSVPEIVDDSPDNGAYREALVRQSIHSTPFGFCTSNLRMNPCDRIGACTSCTKLVCIAGHEDHGPAIRADLERRKIAVGNIREREAAGHRVNPAMKEAMEAQMSHVEVLLDAIEDPANLGSFVANTDAPSLIEFSHQQRIFEARRGPEVIE